jgi:glycosyltransferase involved in cell wall biosynthesis
MLKCAPPAQKSYLALSSPVQEEFETMVKDYVEKFFYLELPTWQKYRRHSIQQKIREPFGDTIRLIKLIPATKNLVTILQENKIDIVHTNNSICPAGAIAAKLKNLPHIWHVRESFGAHSQFKPILGDVITYWLIKNLSKVIICNSKYTAEPFRGHHAELEIIQNGLDVGFYAEAKQKGSVLRTQLNVNENEIVIAMVGNLTTELKRHVDFLQIASIIKNKHQTVRYVVFGGSNNLDQTVYTRRLAIQAKELGIGDRLIWAEFCKDTAAVMNSLDILVHPALTEGSGRVVMEAMAAGKPVVGMQSGGVQELIQDGLTGFLVQPGNVQVMAERVDQLVSNPALRERIGINARKYAQEHFSDQESMNAIVRIYQKLVAEQGR